MLYAQCLAVYPARCLKLKEQEVILVIPRKVRIWRSWGGSAQTGTISADSVYVLSGNQSQPTVLNQTDLTALGTTGLAKPTDKPGTPGTPSTPSVTPAQGNKQFVFRGTGYGHGLGMSQWGARGFAEQGYDYKKILQTYYAGVNITKE